MKTSKDIVRIYVSLIVIVNGVSLDYKAGRRLGAMLLVSMVLLD